MLKRAGISPKPTAALFRRLAKESPQFSAQFLQSHPQSAKRADRFATSFDPIATYRPALDRASADALFNICWKAPASK
jgi:predicted Zn-dependent protease